MQRRYLLTLAASSAVMATDRALQRPPAACDRYRAAVQADSSNLEAAASLRRARPFTTSARTACTWSGA